MKTVIVAMFCLVIASGCLKKNPNSQPCTLKFETDYVQSNQSLVTFTSGLISLKKIEIEGTRSGASSIDIEREWEQTHFIYYMDEAWGPDMDIPAGNYTNIDADFRFRGEQYPSWRFIGSATRNQTTTPLVFEISDDLDFELETSGIPELLKDADYRFLLRVNTDQLVSQLTQSDLDASTLSTFNGQDAIVVSSSSNPQLYSKMRSQLMSALSIRIEP